MSRHWFVYKYTFPNNKIYVGKTYIGSKRFGNSYAYRTQVVYRAMCKYPDYQKEILQYYKTESDAFEGEQTYISQYHSQDPNFGYNITKGGDGMDSELMNQKVIQYSLRGQEMKIWPSLKIAADTIGIAACGITQACHPSIYKNTKTCGGYQWRTFENPEPIFDLGEHYTIPGPKAVRQYTMQGIFIKEWISMKEASRALNIKANLILRVCQHERKSSGGYRWEYAFYQLSLLPELPINEKTNYISAPKTRHICQYDLCGNFVKKWDSIKAAAQYYNVSPSSISHVCLGDIDVVAGYQWRYADAHVLLLKNDLSYKGASINAKQRRK